MCILSFIVHINLKWSSGHSIWKFWELVYIAKKKLKFSDQSCRSIYILLISTNLATSIFFWVVWTNRNWRVKLWWICCDVIRTKKKISSFPSKLLAFRTPTSSMSGTTAIRFGFNMLILFIQFTSLTKNTVLNLSVRRSYNTNFCF